MVNQGGGKPAARQPHRLQCGGSGSLHGGRHPHDAHHHRHGGLFQCAPMHSHSSTVAWASDGLPSDWNPASESQQPHDCAGLAEFFEIVNLAYLRISLQCSPGRQVMETTGALQLIVPIMLTVFVAKVGARPRSVSLHTALQPMLCTEMTLPLVSA